MEMNLNYVHVALYKLTKLNYFYTELQSICYRKIKRVQANRQNQWERPLNRGKAEWGRTKTKDNV